MGGGAVAFTLSVAPTGKSFAAPTAPAGPVVPLDAAPALVAALSMFGFIAGGPSLGTAVLLAAAPTVASGTSGYTALFTASAPGAAPTATTVLAWPAPAGFAFAPATWAPPAGVGYMDTSLTSMATIAGVIASGATLPAGGWVAVAPGGTADAALVRGRPPLVPQALALSTDAITATYFEPARPLTSGVKKIHAEWASHAPWWM